MSTYTIYPDGTAKPIASQPNGQQAMCWVAHVAGNFYVTNTGTANLTGYRIDPAGTPTVFTEASSREAPIDVAGTSDGRFLYAQVGVPGGIDGYCINPDGTLTQIVTLNGINGLQGIAAT